MDVARVVIRMRFAIALLGFGMLLARPPLAAQTSSAAHAQPLGAPLTAIIGFGDQYNGGDELYDARITVLEIVRGPKAWDVLQRAGGANQPPKPGFDYVLARIRFEFSARTSPQHYSYTLLPNQFTAMSSGGKEYDSPALAAPPNPPLGGTLRSGDSAEGWIVFRVPQSDRKPLMLFREDVGSVFHEGGGSFFQLYYPDSSVPGKTKA
jgi:hypothetical protein